MSEFKDDIKQLFRKEKGGHVDKWIYTSGGSAHWHNFLAANNNYYLRDAETEALQMHLARIGYCAMDTMVDMGVGDEIAVSRKALEILGFIRDIKHYIGVDLSKSFLKAAKDTIENSRPDVKVSLINKDFYENAIDLTGNSKLGVMLGSTITNQNMMMGEEFPRAKITKKLSQIRQHFNANDSFFVGYDANPDLNNAADAYIDDNWSLMFTQLMHKIKDELNPEGNFNPDAWKHNRSIDAASHVIHQTVVAQENQTFLIDGEAFNVKKGDAFVITNNFKYPLPLFKDMASDAGWLAGDYTFDSSGRAVILELVA